MVVVVRMARVKTVATIVGMPILALANNSLIKECSKFRASDTLKPLKACMIVVNKHTMRYFLVHGIMIAPHINW